MTSKHYTKDRKAREELIQQIGEGTPVKEVRVDRGHRNGAEIHVISTTAIITIYNERTHKMITKLIARPGQIRRYYNANETIPVDLLRLAKEHTKARYNEVR